MTVEELIKYAEDYHAQSVKLLKGKNEDYTKSKTDALSNFQASVDNGSVDKLWQAVAVFYTTKFERIKSLVANGVEPNNEAIQDTFLDLDNYGMFLKVAVERELCKKGSILSVKCVVCKSFKVCRSFVGGNGEKLMACSTCGNERGIHFND